MTIVFDKATHTYYQKGVPMISVTQLLRKHGLAPDYSSVPVAVLAKSAERGNSIHADVEEVFKKRFPTTPEGEAVASWLVGRQVENVSTEEIISNGEIAGTYDILCELAGQTTLIDIKTTSSKQQDYWTWQLSLYSYLLGKSGVTVQVIGDLWIHDGKVEFIVHRPKPLEEIEKLLEAERNGVGYLKTVDNEEQGLLLAISEKALAIMNAEAFVKSAKAEIAEGQERLLAEMERRGIKSLVGGGIRVTYVAPSVRKTVDSKKLFAEHPELSGLYDKSSNVKASLRIEKYEEEA